MEHQVTERVLHLCALRIARLLKVCILWADPLTQVVDYRLLVLVEI
jgi:hypothetical protein